MTQKRTTKAATVKAGDRMVWVEGWVVTVTAPNGAVADLSLDGGETTAYFLTSIAAKVAARRHVGCAHRWRVRYVFGFYPARNAPKPGGPLPAAPWWQNDGPTWWTRCEGKPPSHPLPVPYGVDAKVWNTGLEVLALSMYP